MLGHTRLCRKTIRSHWDKDLVIGGSELWRIDLKIIDYFTCNSDLGKSNSDLPF